MATSIVRKSWKARMDPGSNPRADWIHFFQGWLFPTGCGHWPVKIYIFIICTVKLVIPLTGIWYWSENECMRHSYLNRIKFYCNYITTWKLLSLISLNFMVSEVDSYRLQQCCPLLCKFFLHLITSLYITNFAYHLHVLSSETHNHHMLCFICAPPSQLQCSYR